MEAQRMIIEDETSPPWDEDIYEVRETLPKTITLAAQTRVNGPSIRSLPPALILQRVKKKIGRKLYDQLMASNLIKITSVTAPNGSVTFTATLEAVEATPDATP